MADKKISQLTAATTPLAGTEVLPIVQGGSTVKVSAADITAGRAISATSVAVGDGSAAAPSVTNTGDTNTGMFFPAENEIGFATDSAERVRISANGQLLVGATANPGAMNKSVVIDSGASSLAGLVLQNNATGRTFADGGQIYIVGTELRIQNGENDILMFLTNGTERGQFTAAGDLRIKNNLVLDTAAKGIDFSANTHAAGMTSELLDWYEEGFWTPVPVPTSGSITSYTSEGQYNRVGNKLFVNFRITITNVGTATNLSNVTGLPFSNAASPAVGAGSERGVSGDMWQWVVGSGTTLNGWAYDNDSTIVTGAILYGSITYMV